MSFQSKSKTGVISSQQRGKESTRSRKAIAKGKLNPKVMGMFKVPRNAIMRKAMEKIAIAPIHQKSMRKKDSKAIYKYYNRNQSIHQMMNTCEGKQIGTCGPDSLTRMKSMPERKAMRVQMELSTACAPGHPKKSVNHYAVIYKDENHNKGMENKWRYESYGNGKHMDTTLFLKLCNQDCFRVSITNSNLEWDDEFEVLRIFEVFLKDRTGKDEFGFGLTGDRYVPAVEMLGYAVAMRQFKEERMPAWLK